MARTPSASAHQKVIDAAIELVADRGVDATSMDAIAAKSGVSKATIYKHWLDKDALLLEIMAELHGLHTRPQFDTGDIQASIAAILSYRLTEHSVIRERIMPQFLAYSATNVSFGQAWRNIVMEPPRRELKYMLQTGIDNGELAPDLNLDHSLAMLLGPILYWKIFLKDNPHDPRDLAEEAVAAFWKAFGTGKRNKRRSVR